MCIMYTLFYWSLLRISCFLMRLIVNLTCKKTTRQDIIETFYYFRTPAIIIAISRLPKLDQFGKNIAKISDDILLEKYSQKDLIALLFQLNIKETNCLFITDK